MPIDKIIVIIGGIGLIGFIVWYFLMRPEEEPKRKIVSITIKSVYVHKNRLSYRNDLRVVRADH